MLLLIIIFIATIFLAYANGANDNFKGVATLFGSKTLSYKTALWLATGATFAGALCSIYFAGELVKNFSGKGLVPDQLTRSPHFILAVALGAGCTVMLATISGFPISTTHSLVGALIGAGLMAVGSDVNVARLGNVFIMPLLASPFIAFMLAGLLYMTFRLLRLRLGVDKDTYLYMDNPTLPTPVSISSSPTILKFVSESLFITTMKKKFITYYASGTIVGINSQRLLDGAHYVSAGLVSFARGLNDTPKIVALLVAVKVLDIGFGMSAIALGMAFGGLLNARKVAHKMSNKITSMNNGQGFTANLVTAFLVIIASRMGMPVSTTHVSVGSIFGIGMVSKNANKRVVGEVILSWVLTLPIAAFLSALMYFLIQKV